MLKQFFKRILPASYKKIDCTKKEVESLVHRNLDTITARLDRLEERLETAATQQKQEIDRIRNLSSDALEFMEDFSGILTKKLSTLPTAESVSKLATADEVSRLETAATQTEKLLQAQLEVVKKSESNAYNAQKSAEEAVWAAIFHDAIQDSAWLTDKKFFPGRWAAGYPALYAIYRVLENFRPKKILELGLGQSTRIIGQYATSFSNVSHIVCEMDENWIDFFKADFALPKNTKIRQFDYALLPFKDTFVRQYSGFTQAFRREKFDFIFIDAPLGGDMKDFSRIDVLTLLPDCLEDSFVIMLDDWNRPQEKNTLSQMENVLKENAVAYRRGIYSGQKQTALLCSEDIGFLASM